MDYKEKALREHDIILDDIGLEPVCKVCHHFGTLAENCCYQCSMVIDIMIMQRRYMRGNNEK